MRCYLDHNATSPLRPAARRAMLAASEVAGNASSIHAEGRAARKLLDDARDVVAKELGVLPGMVVFTSGGSEANNLAIKGAAVDRILVSAIEHPSVLEAARATGKPVEVIPVTSAGQVDLAALARMLAGPKALVSVMLANNETGAIQPIREIAALAATSGTATAWARSVTLIGSAASSSSASSAPPSPPTDLSASEPAIAGWRL